MTIEQIEKKLEQLEDKSIHNHEERFLEFLLEDYVEGGYDCCIDNSDKGWFISELIEALNELFFEIGDLKLDHDLSYSYFKRIIKCKYELDKKVIRENLPVDYYDSQYFESEINSKKYLPSVIESSKKNEELLRTVYKTLKSLKLIDCDEQYFIDGLSGKTHTKMKWKGAKNKLAIFAKVITPVLSDEYRDKRFVAIAQVFKWKNKSVTNEMLADAFDKAVNKTVESFEANFKNTIS